MVSPIMSAAKKPSSRRAVFDATFGPHSLNSATPSEEYLGETISYSYPRLEDFQHLILKCGSGCFLFKRDLSRYYLQLPLDPVEYCYTGAVWRLLYFFFVSLMFGLRHSGYQGQKVSDAISWVHKNLGLEYVLPADQPSPVQEQCVEVHSDIRACLDHARPQTYNNVNYCDDFGGVEWSLHKATASFNALGSLLSELGVVEAADKSCPPATSMVFLGVHFDSVNMVMSIPQEKLQELRSDLEVWMRKTTAVRKDLQSILGKLFWVSRVVQYSRPFMGRLLQQLRDMAGVLLNRKIKLSAECKKDIVWWSTYLRHFNGKSAITNTEDIKLSFEELFGSAYHVYAGDATLWGGGGWYESEYWSRQFPDFLMPSDIAVHVKEFWVMIASAWLWGDQWSGKCIYMFCDNDSVVDCITYQKPKDKDMLSLLREFLYVVCMKKFTPIARKIGTATNSLADHISRRHDHESASKVFSDAGKPGMARVSVPDSSFKLSAPW